MKKKVFRERYYGKPIVEDAKTEKIAPKTKITRKNAAKKGDK